MAKKQECPAGSPAWMATFSDMNQLLMTFFIALFAMSSISPGKFQQMAQSFNNVFEGKPIGVLVGGKSIQDEPLITENNGVKQDLMKIINDERFKGKITIKETDRGTIISLKDMSYFKQGSAELTALAKSILAEIGTIIIEHTTNEIEIYGFTDDSAVTPNNIYPSNWHLGAARAASVAYFFTNELKKRRMLERIGEVKTGNFDIDYFYNPDRFFPISVGDRDIKKEITNLKSELESQKSIYTTKFQTGEITAVDLKEKEKELNKNYENELERLRKIYRRIDILILRQRIR
ncbi:flagellar motor protein MotB [Tepiditoga spiralis]|uniref:Flagellar motor protein MotB n=1 Tax=Tepiditoga spiralis TaxID=2108365 RepID=A0A7G1G6C3_9BACT|nr:flagellar motor protein MotB [Tepiditoga spiralis]BBE32150.1 flagellar motor protein MotB [Tepiditoga spiralis]